MAAAHSHEVNQKVRGCGEMVFRDESALRVYTALIVRCIHQLKGLQNQVQRIFPMSK